MARETYTPTFVTSRRLARRNINWIRINRFEKSSYYVEANVPHAVVRGRNHDLGIVLYPEENGLPYCKFSRMAKYTFLMPGNVVRAALDISN